MTRAEHRAQTWKRFCAVIRVAKYLEQLIQHRFPDAVANFGTLANACSNPKELCVLRALTTPCCSRVAK